MPWQQTQRFDSTTSDLGHTWDNQAPISLSAGWDTSYYTIMFDDIMRCQFRQKEIGVVPKQFANQANSELKQWFADWWSKWSPFDFFFFTYTFFPLLLVCHLSGFSHENKWKQIKLNPSFNSTVQDMNQAPVIKMSSTCQIQFVKCEGLQSFSVSYHSKLKNTAFFRHHVGSMFEWRAVTRIPLSGPNTVPFNLPILNIKDYLDPHQNLIGSILIHPPLK